MNRATFGGLVIASLVFAGSTASAQEFERSAAIVSGDVASQVSAFSYKEGPKSKLILAGTPLTPLATGEASVEFQDGRSIVKAEVKKLPDPTTLGPYTTYVLWAITPVGRSANIGAIAVSSSGRGDLKTSYSGSQFALVITAEPHFAVSVPSTALVLYNVAKKVKGEETKIRSLAERANYANLQSIRIDPKTAPASIVSARYAVAIAAAVGAEKYATAAYDAAHTKLEAAEVAQVSRKSRDRKQAPLLARDATLAAEDARRAALSAKAAAEEEARRQAAAQAAAAEAAEAQRLRSEEIAAEAARNDLRDRLNRVLPTRVSSRGLISEIGGVQFASGTSNLGGGARESLAKFAGVVASYPDLHYTIEGHTDDTGSDATNRELSYKRGLSVRDYLIGQGIPASSIDVNGFGSSMPIADNSTDEGRARNRRVEIVVSGGPLGK
jgi:outer membrane protein OmpA-like peptidoglycan-associated protein